MANITVEVCCGSADDVFQAKKAGAHRVELNSGMFLGGLTPSMGEVRVAQKAGLSIMAMVRPRQGGFCYTPREFETMLADAEALCAEGVEGIVFGILLPDGQVDAARCGEMLRVIGARQAVFHRAIDVTPDWRAALNTLIDLGFARVLTSGQHPSVHYGAPVVRQMVEHAAGRIEILPGAGINLHNAEEILEKTGCNQLHVLLDKQCSDPSTAHNQSIFYGGALYPPEAVFSMADDAALARLMTVVAPQG